MKSQEKAIKIQQAIKESEERLKKRLDSIPEINWEILKYCNGHSKEEVLEKYPEHKDFIETIVFNN